MACWEASRFCKGQAIKFESKGAFRRPAGLSGGRVGGSTVSRPPCDWRPAGSAGEGGNKMSLSLYKYINIKCGFPFMAALTTE